MATQSKRKTPVAKAQPQDAKIEKALTVEKSEPKEEVVLVPASDYRKLLDSLEQFMNKEITSGHKNEDQKIQLGESIEVVSLSPGIVNATTSGGDNNGRTYAFRAFGMSMEIPYGDLVNIVQNHFKLFERGYLYVNDARFTKTNGLEQVTKNVLNKEQMERIVYGNSPEDLHLFENATVVQKEHMVSMLITDVNDGKEVDMNRIHSVSKFVGYDVSDRAKQFKQMFEKPE